MQQINSGQTSLRPPLFPVTNVDEKRQSNPTSDSGELLILLGLIEASVLNNLARIVDLAPVVQRQDNFI